MSRLLALSSVLAFACVSDLPAEDEAPPAGFTFDGGAFTLTANAVTDGCLDGAAEVVALPNVGSADPSREFTNPLTFPGTGDAFPFTSTLDLVAPFTAVDVTWTNPTEFAFDWDPEATNVAVALGDLNDAWLGCEADFAFGGTFDAVMAADGDIKFVGTTHFGVTGTNDDAACPVFANPTPCAIDLEMIATRN